MLDRMLLCIEYRKIKRIIDRRFSGELTLQDQKDYYKSRFRIYYKRYHRVSSDWFRHQEFSQEELRDYKKAVRCLDALKELEAGFSKLI